MKSTLILFVLFFAISISNAQTTNYKTIVAEYKAQVDLLTAGKEFDMPKMASLAEEIWCGCTIEQLKKAGDAMNHESEGVRARNCNSAELPTTKIISDELLNTFIAQVARIKKHYGMN